MKRILPNLKNFAFMNFGIILMSIGIYFFKTPNKFATGGVSGLSIILHNIFPDISQGVFMLTINALLLVLGIIVLGKECGTMTIYCSLMLSLENLIFETFIPIEMISGQATLSAYPLLELIYAVLLTGIGSAILFRNKASSGGTDIVALILKKHSQLNVSQALLATDFLIALSTFLVYDNVSVGLYAMLGLFSKIFIIDDILDSMNLCKAFTIITTKPQEISTFILNDMKHGATMYKGEGLYTHEQREIIMTVCKRSEAIRLRRKVKSIDPDAFVIITKTSEIFGKGF